MRCFPRSLCCPARLRALLTRRLPSSLVPRSSVQAAPRPLARGWQEGAASECSCVVLRAPAARVSRGRSRIKVLAGQEQQPELADLHFIPPGQLRLLDALPVDVGAIEAAHVPDGEECALAVKLRVPS